MMGPDYYGIPCYEHESIYMKMETFHFCFYYGTKYKSNPQASMRAGRQRSLQSLRLSAVVLILTPTRSRVNEGSPRGEDVSI